MEKIIKHFEEQEMVCWFNRSPLQVYHRPEILENGWAFDEVLNRQISDFLYLQVHVVILKHWRKNEVEERL